MNTLKTPNNPSSPFFSRHLLKDDPYLYRYAIKLSRFKSLEWNFINSNWWSRSFEYLWVINVLSTINGSSQKKVLDAAGGDKYPLAFMVHDMGFTVSAQDLYSSHPLIPNPKYPRLSYSQHDLLDPQKQKFDVVLCISVLEHLSPENQLIALNNLARSVKKGGYLLFSFEDPGFEYDTDIKKYFTLLKKLGFQTFQQKTKDSDHLTSHNGLVKLPPYKQVNRKYLSTFRIFAQKK